MLKVLLEDAKLSGPATFDANGQIATTCDDIEVGRYEVSSKTLTVFPPSIRLVNKFLDYHVRCPIVAGAQEVTVLEGDPKHGHRNRSGISLTR